MKQRKAGQGLCYESNKGNMMAAKQPPPEVVLFKTFKSKFPNLSFKSQRTDTCDKCDLLNAEMKCQPGDKTLQKKLELHHHKAERARVEMKKNNMKSQFPTSDTCTLLIDLQQVLSIPALTILKCTTSGTMMLQPGNACDNNEVLLSMWHEAMHGRGAKEIAPCLLKGVESNIMCGKKKTYCEE
ncbi:hypothetical protein J6590_014151 [Homalodisca vitripennis]|nr:hypothetical protein J6590_014151 [Homalodisca vitripennis]